eukprot:TRINITY_DN103_c0_g4_i4.p1 TRINITY_DN103_c0_g4~~TRINITY_DN103_c0_g4_i4.p1  ORF type:complete len:1548 (-),score=441.14 TRINITY_DN103_c0_g4_i4:36-4301(-)
MMQFTNNTPAMNPSGGYTGYNNASQGQPTSIQQGNNQSLPPQHTPYGANPHTAIAPAGITSHQLFQLRAQILAFKYLSRNMALPSKLLAAIRTFSMRSLQYQSQIQQQQQPPQPMQGGNSLGAQTSISASTNPQTNTTNLNLINASNIPSQSIAGQHLTSHPVASIPQQISSAPTQQNTNPVQGQQLSQQQIQQQFQKLTPSQQHSFIQALKSGASQNPQLLQFLKQQQSVQQHRGFISSEASLNNNVSTHTSTPVVGANSMGITTQVGAVSNQTSSAITTGANSGVMQAIVSSDADSVIFAAVGGKPEALTLAFMLQEREKRIRGRINKRMDELNSIPLDVSVALRRRAMIELKQLRLLDLQKKLRSEVTLRMRKILGAEIATDPSLSKRMKKKEREQFIKEAHMRPESIRKIDIEEIKEQKHKEFLNAVTKHCIKFKEYFAEKQKSHKKFLKVLQNHHTNRQKQLQLEEERKKRARLEALRNEDEDTYLMYLDQAKNERVHILLKQTDEYLERLGALLETRANKDDIEERKKIKSTKKKKGQELENQDGKKQEDESKNSNENLPASASSTEASAPAPSGGTARAKIYYTKAHKIQEVITEQPNMIIGGKLKNYQLQGLQWLVSLYNNKLNGILADEMGLGKTIQTISLIGHLMEKKLDYGPYLVVVPLSTMSNWVLEFGKWAPSVKIVIYKGSPQIRKSIYKDQLTGGLFNVLVTSYEYVMMDKADLGKIEWNYIIVDEGHRIKNKNSKLSTILRQYMSRHRLLLTGTPLQNDLTELWSLLNFLLPDIFKTSESFEQWFNAPFAFSKSKKGKEDSVTITLNEEETLLIIHRLHKVLRPFILRRLKSDVESELPDKIETVLKCELSAMQKKIYKNIVEKKTVALAESSKGRKKLGFTNTLVQLQKLCNHPYLFQDSYNVNNDLIRVSGKFDVLDRILPKLRKAGHRILIFNQMTQIMNIMEDYFAMKGWTHLRLDGNTKSEDRSEMMKLWNMPESPYWLFILSTKAGGLGLNLQTADTVIIFDTDWNPQADLQAQDRAHRIGQKKQVQVFRLVTQNSIEEDILARATFKLDVDAKVIQAGMFNNHANDKMRADMLESLLHNEDDNKEDEVVTNDDQINRTIALNDEEFSLYQQMDVERYKMEEAEWRAKGLPVPPRLMTEAEVPEWMNIIDEEEEDITVSHGRGRRERTEISYNSGHGNELNELLGSSSDDEEDHNRSRKRGREYETNDEEMKGGKGKGKTLSRGDNPSVRVGKVSGEHLSQLHENMEEVWNTVIQHQEEGRILSLVFMKLVPRKEYPDYYKIIKKPMSFNKIQENIKKYRNANTMKDDFLLVFSNAKTYNEVDSVIYNDANTLQNVFTNEYNKRFTPAGTVRGSEGENQLLLEEVSNSSVSKDRSEDESSDDEVGEEMDYNYMDSWYRK